MGAAPGVRDMGAVGWGAGAATAGIHDRDGRGRGERFELQTSPLTVTRLQ